MSRDPELWNVHTSRVGGLKTVRVGLIYRGLKGEPADSIDLTHEEAVSLATRLLLSAARVRGERL